MPEAYLFANGNALYFDEDGEQITELQTDGWGAVQRFKERYPEASVHFAVWRDSAYELSDRAIGYIANETTNSDSDDR